MPPRTASGSGVRPGAVRKPRMKTITTGIHAFGPSSGRCATALTETHPRREALMPPSCRPSTAAPHPGWIGDFPDGRAGRFVVAWTHLLFLRRAG